MAFAYPNQLIHLPHLLHLLPVPWAAGALCGPRLLAPDAFDLLRLLLLAPALEECVLRAGLQEWLIRRGTPAGPGSGVSTGIGSSAGASIAISTLAFGALHLGAGWQQAALVLAPGLALAWLYQRGRRWRWCALLHAGFNACALSVCGP